MGGDDDYKVVLVSQDEFDSWKETLYLLSNPANAAHLRRSIAEARADKLEEQALIDDEPLELVSHDS